MAEDQPFMSSATQQHPHIYRPIPRRDFAISRAEDLVPEEAGEPLEQSTPPILLRDAGGGSSDWLAQLNARLLRTRAASNGNTNEYGTDRGGMERNKSLLNMTSSTLFGIYDDAGSSTASERSELQTPWGTGAETPARKSADYAMGGNGWESVGGPDAGLRMKGLARRGTVDSTLQPRTQSTPTIRRPRHGLARATAIAGKVCALFLFGLVYGVLVSHLHDTRELAAVRVGGVGRESWIYLASWGLAGVVLGSLLPYVDVLWDARHNAHRAPEAAKEKEAESSLSEQWNEVVRSVGAFFGIAFAIRRLPWQSTLQLTLTLALVNPALWYILDRSKPGLSLSLLVTSILTTSIFLSNPDVLPSPALPPTTNSTHLSHGGAGHDSTAPTDLFAGVVSYETLAVVTWVGSVLFCSCVCFGNIGRRLAVWDEWGSS
ncbi:hypothetical protein EJ04DRAFT_554204 [Polyplosphaeria fusca]|uniref:Uncharacterized protein n=1 Tax=Polyplosphaeria fusca TaxID=682080 RepID=A0A9P4UZB7_9PLEO|nr:hypothetical protein EJ04DRAFT_554204 [Polyplosphaeria fusca]